MLYSTSVPTRYRLLSVGTLQETNIFEGVGLFLVYVCYVVYVFNSRSGKA